MQTDDEDLKSILNSCPEIQGVYEGKDFCTAEINAMKNSVLIGEYMSA